MQDLVSYDHKNLPGNVEFRTENVVTGLSCDSLSQLCSSAGLQDVKERVAVFPVGWNGPIGNLAAADTRQMATGASRAVFMAGRDEASYQKLLADAFKQAGELLAAGCPLLDQAG
ncbi:hypothetical protein HK405_004514 [Cladochytrium tenue]|nr:hypothetical protein HK405_004514 [Cladochytrium tenue]